ncbi:MAG: 2-C-methyl-D-erythritol 4-phosphate cytidylyltransferase [Candidatus Competibacteraceae bacterium]|nr:2-C-methyl-D-erythritol 4-phosphate cytidylyltransferase [Candidatus Competibacteraceae bacterium]
MNETGRYWAVVPAAGIGKRMEAHTPKQYLVLAGVSVIVHTLETLLSHPRISGVVVVINPNDEWWDTLHLESDKPLITTTGGEERCHSVRNGLLALTDWAQPDDWVLVHDAARPCLHRTDLDKLLDTLAADPVGGLLAMPVRDTMKRSDAHERIAATVERQNLWHALTPQMFRLNRLLAALQQAEERNLQVTDEASAIEAMGLQPRLVEGRADNIKITRPEDMALAEFYLTGENG